jgi:hypothetical protein
MGLIVCEECLYAGEKKEFEEHSEYCKECLYDHAMCPKCKTAYHSALITE